MNGRTAALKHVWILTAVIAFFGLASGLLITATPQAALALGFSSRDIGAIGSGIPIGYATSCLLFWRLAGRLTSKHVLLCGILGALASMVLMALGRSVGVCTAAQVGFGLSGGAFWPFASAWLLDFQDEKLPKTRLLRHYNVGWTSGTSVGMFLAGYLCKQGLIRETLFAGAAIIGAVFVAACCARAKTPSRGREDRRGEGAPPVRPLADARGSDTPRIGLPLLIAAASANIAALATRAMILNNYPELNKALNFGADRMGLLTALTLVSQFVAFSVGAVYEPWLGLRRLYVFMAAALVAVNLAFAYSSGPSLLALVAAVLLHGVVLAVAFQTGIIAATAYFSVARTGTTFHEATVGSAGVAVLAAGHLVAHLKGAGVEPLAALRAPFFVMAGLVAVVLAVQLVLVSLRNRQRVLLPATASAESSAK